jgi:hypothetical protein
MTLSNELDDFVDSVMRINIMRMGGAFTGIVGASGTGSTVVYELRKSVMAFANEYHQPTPSHDQLERLSQEITGHLRILQLSYTLSEKEADKLIDQLVDIMAKP